MIGATSFTVWMHRSPASVFGAASRPVDRGGVTLAFEDEYRARAECARLATGSGDPHTRYSVERKFAISVSLWESLSARTPTGSRC